MASCECHVCPIEMPREDEDDGNGEMMMGYIGQEQALGLRIGSTNQRYNP